MLPTSTSNDTYDARRRRNTGVRGTTIDGSEREVASVGPRSQDNYVPTFLVALDSPAERVAARKRKLRNRQPGRGAEAPPPRVAEPHKTVDAERDGSSQADIPSFLITNQKKKLSSSISSRSLDSAADLLERERMENRHPPRQQQSRSHHQRITVPLVDTSSASPMDDSSSSMSSSLRSSLTGFRKSMRRHMNRSFNKQNSSKFFADAKRNQSAGSSNEVPKVKSSSERRARTVPLLVPTAPSQVISSSDHPTPTWKVNKKQIKRRGSDTDLITIANPGLTDTNVTGHNKSTKKKQARASTGSSKTATTPSPGLMKKLWSSTQRLSSSGQGSSSRLNTSSSRLNSSSSSSRHFSILDDDDHDQDIPALDVERHTSSSPAIQAIKSEDESESARPPPLTKVLSARLKRKANKRDELVQELSSRDSLRTRDRTRSVGEANSETGSNINGKMSLSLPRANTEFSTEEESQADDKKPMAKTEGRGAAAGGDGNMKKPLRSPYDDDDNYHASNPFALMDEEPSMSFSTQGNDLASILSSVTLSSAPSLVEVERVGKLPAARKIPVEEDSVAGAHPPLHSSWPAHSERQRKESKGGTRRRRSSSVGIDTSRRRSKGKQEATGPPSTTEVRHRRSSSAHQKTSAKKASPHGSKTQGSIPTSSHSRSTKGDKKSREKRQSSRSRSRKRQGGSYTSLLDADGKNKSSNEKKKGSKAPTCDSSEDTQRRRGSFAVSEPEGQGIGKGTSKKSPHTPTQRKPIFEHDVSEQSLTVDDIANLDGSSSKSLGASSSREPRSAETKKKRRSRKKDEQLSSSSSTSNGRRLRRPKSGSESSVAGRLAQSSHDPSETKVHTTNLGAVSVSRVDALEGVPSSKKGVSKTKESPSRPRVKKSPKVKANIRTIPEGTTTEDAMKAKGSKSLQRENAESSSKPRQDSKKGSPNWSEQRLRNSITGTSAATEAPNDSQVRNAIESPASPNEVDGNKALIGTQLRLEGGIAGEGARRKAEESGGCGAEISCNPNGESNSSLPALSDYLSVGSNDSSINSTKSSDETQPQTTISETASTAPGTVMNTDVRPTHEAGTPASSKNAAGVEQPCESATELKMEGLALKKDTFLSLNAIASGAKTGVDGDALDGPAARESFDAMRLHAVDIFHDGSPNGSPLSNSMPHLWNVREGTTVLERLASSMPNLVASEGNVGVARDVPASPIAACGVDDEGTGIFQDDSSSGSQDLPELESIAEDHQSDVISRISGQGDERCLPVGQSIQPRPSADKGFDAFVNTTADDVPEQPLVPACASQNNRVFSPRTAKAINPKGKVDRGPAIPRRSNSFEQDKDGSPETTESSEEAVPGSSLEELNSEVVNAGEGSLSSLAYSSRSMEFLRTNDNGWVQTPPGSLSSLDTANNAEPPAEASAMQQPHDVGDNHPSLRIRRRASMSDLEAARDVCNDRWHTSLSSVEGGGDTAPVLSRQSYPVLAERLSHSMNADELRNLFWSPKDAGEQKAERSYLPVCLQSAARRYERAGKQLPVERRSIEGTRGMSRVEKANLDPDEDDEGNPGSGDDNGVAVETGLSDMFEMIGELEEDLLKFENQVALLRAQRQRRTERESSSEDGDY
ncbi:expressed unknown protein [Seminavis robusta]|uniref:Uncharacterized protein n=1 Tax=Seminavis robusta TaxID=568900 RepID=A0A9N8HCT9_9STRA|nr:expressed unknown protein [Seminavis robusta]|eukprot:Sro316_g115560.1 n/a (1604) ;mRNA; r:55499-60310